MSESIKPADFEALDAPLMVKVPGVEAPLPFTVQSLRRNAAHRFREEPFAVEFAGPASPHLPQAIYAMTHPRLGEIEIFLVPVARDAESVRYEATFN